MSYLLIREFPELGSGQDPGGQTLVCAEPPILETQITVSSIPVLFGPFQPATKFVELCAQTTASIMFGITGVITSTSITTGNGRLQSNDRVVRRIAFSPGQPNGPNGLGNNTLSISAVICSAT